MRIRKIVAGSALALAVASAPSIDLPIRHLAALAVSGKHDALGAGLASATRRSAGAVPEPATWAMLILGMAMIGFAARRRNQRAPHSLTDGV